MDWALPLAIERSRLWNWRPRFLINVFGYGSGIRACYWTFAIAIGRFWLFIGSSETQHSQNCVFGILKIWNLTIWKRRPPKNDRELSGQKSFDFRGVLAGEKNLGFLMPDAWCLMVHGPLLKAYGSAGLALVPVGPPGLDPGGSDATSGPRAGPAPFGHVP